MNTTRFTNTLLLVIAVLLGLILLRPPLMPEAQAAAKPWQTYVPLTVTGDSVYFFATATGDLVSQS
jgi:hypothetical protein